MATLNTTHVELNSDIKLDFMYRNKLGIMTSSFNEVSITPKST